MSTAIVSQPVRRFAPAAVWPVRLITRWHLLSLDAPSVALAWLLMLNRATPMHQSGLEAAALAIAVWMIYVLDRLLDAERQVGPLQQRHRFHQANRLVFLGMLLLLSPVLVLLVVALPAHVRLVWLALGLPLLLYAACVHFFRNRVPKELIVGLFFAAVVTVPSWSSSALANTMIQAAAFCVLCWWNCLLISTWEAKPARSRNHAFPGSLLLQWMPVLSAGASLACLMYADTRPAGVAAMLSGALLILLHRNRLRLDPVLLRSLADAALLTPLFVVPFLHRL